MAYKNFTGTLRDANNNPIPLAAIKFTATATSDEVLQSVTATVKTDINGHYDLNLNHGRYEISIKTKDSKSFYVLVKDIVINSETVETDLNSLISNFNETDLLTPALLTEMRNLDASARDSADMAAASAQAAANSLSGVKYTGTWDAATGQLPDTTNLTQGAMYEVTGAGNVNGVDYKVGDRIIYNGTDWDHIDIVVNVTSVSGKTGAVTLTKEDVGLSNVLDVASYSKSETNDLLNTKLGKDDNAKSADKLTTPRTITLTGDIYGVGSFDGSANITINSSLMANGHTHTISTVEGLSDSLDSKINAVNGSASDLTLGKTLSVVDYYSSLNAGTGVKIYAQDGILKIESNFNESNPLDLTVDGNSVYHMGNFDPATKANTTGTYDIRATATTKEDVGLSNVLDVASYSKSETDTLVSPKLDADRLIDFVQSQGDIQLSNATIPSLTKFLNDNEIGYTRGQVPDDYVSGELRLVVDGQLSTQVYRPVDSFVPLAGDEVFAVKDIVVGVIADNQPLMENFCKFYGYPQAINSLWDVEAAAEFYSQFHGVVWGDGYGEPTHPENAVTAQIAARLKQLRPNVKIFGYVPIGLDPAWPDSNYPLETLYQRIDNWQATGATHIFLDEFGYDYYITRDRQNALVQYCHDKGMYVCANSWSADYCFSNQNIILDWADNFEGNPNLLPSLLTDQDYIQFENVLYKYHHEPGEGSYADPDQWVNDNQRIVDMYEYMYQPQAEFNGQSYYQVYGTKGYALDAVLNYDKKMYAESYLVALALGMHAHAASVAFWGAGSSTYYTYPTPKLRANSRAALREAQPSDYADTYIGRVRTQVGPDEIEVTWIQDVPERNFDETSVSDGLDPKLHIFAVEIPPDTTVLTDGWFTLTLGDSTDDAYGLSVSVTTADTQQTLLDKIANYSYSVQVLDVYDVTRETNRVVFTSKEPHTEEKETWWVWHTEGMLSNTIDSFTMIQVGSNGLSKDFREVRLNGTAVDYGFGPYWRRPRQVDEGYIYYDTTNQRNIIYRNGKWLDLQGNPADAYVKYYNATEVNDLVFNASPTESIVLIPASKPVPTGWAICDGTNGLPDLTTAAPAGTVYIMHLTTPA